MNLFGAPWINSMSKRVFISSSFAMLLLLAGAGWLIFALSGPPVLKPPHMSELDPLVADYVERGVRAVNANRRSREARLQLGMVYEANGLNDLARQCYEQLTAMRSPSPRVFYRLALLHESEGDVSNAIKHVKRSIERDDSYAPLHWRLGYWLLDDGQTDEAEVAFERAIELEHSNLAAWFGLARVHIQRGELDEAIELIESRLLASREPAYAYSLLAEAHRRARHMELADRAARRAGDDGSREPRWRDPWAEELTQYATGYARLRHHAEFLVSTRRFNEAVDLLERLRAETEKDAPLLNMLGVAYITQGRTELGLRTLNEALEYDSRYYPLLINLARAYLRVASQGHGGDVELSLALAEVRRAIEVNPDSGEAHALLGSIQQQLQDHDAAIKAYLKSFELDARRVQPLLAAAGLELQLERWDDALVTSGRIVRHEPYSGEGHLMMAAAMLELGLFKVARDALNEAERIGVRSAADLNNLRQRLENAGHETNGT